MDKWLEKMYESYLEDRYPLKELKKEKMDKEYETYLVLCEGLPKEFKELFREYVRTREERCNVEMAAAYESGFKGAVQLIFSCIKEGRI